MTRRHFREADRQGQQFLEDFSVKRISLWYGNMMLRTCYMILFKFMP